MSLEYSPDKLALSPPDANVPSEPNLAVIVYKSLGNNPAAGVVHVICGFAIIFLN
jgi:hypothetical protein